MQDSFSTIFQSTLRFFSGTLISRISGFLRDVATAFAFGTHPSVGGFLLAYRLAHLLRRVLGEGCLQQAFIPLYEKTKQEEGSESAFSFFLMVRKRLIQAVIPIIILLMAILSYWVESEVALYTLLMLPSLLFIALFGLNASLLQAHQSFFAPAAAPVIMNFFWAIGALSLQFLPTEKAMLGMTGMINLGSLAQWGATLPLLKPIRPLNKKLVYSSSNWNALLKNIGLALLGVSAVQINGALDSLFARMVDSSGPAYLWYAIRIQQLPLGLFSIALSSALLPPLSRSIGRGDLKTAQSLFQLSLSKAIHFLLPITFGLLLAPQKVIEILFGWGKFGEISIEKTASCLVGYTFALLPSTVVMITASVYFAFGSFQKTAKGSLYAVASNVIFNTFFLFVLNWGPEGIAYGTSTASLINALFLMKNLPFDLPPIWPILKTTALCLAAFSSALIFSQENIWIGILSYLPLLFGMGWLFQSKELFFWRKET